MSVKNGRAEQVYEQLLEDIVRRHYHVEDALVVSALARRYRTSELTVRGALRRLEWEGFVRSAPHCSPTVREFSFSELAQLHHLCGVVEGHAARLGAMQLRAERLDWMRDINKSMQDAWKAKNLAWHTRLDRAFHLVLYRAGRNRLLVDTILGYWRREDIIRRMLITSPPRPLYNCRRDHEHILKLLADKRGDGDRIEAAMRDHKLRAGYRLGYGLPPGMQTPVADLLD